MSNVVSLRRARKAKRRADAANEAAANRLDYGRSRAARAQEEIRAEQARRLLDGARLNSRELANDGE